jgi:hypothetical protein
MIDCDSRTGITVTSGNNDWSFDQTPQGQPSKQPILSRATEPADGKAGGKLGPSFRAELTA